MSKEQKIVIIAGPNGAGKTTFAREFLVREASCPSSLYARYIPLWRKIGYRIKLIFLSLPDVEIALERVRVRVTQGGHDVEESVIRRRFDKGWNNFHNIYKDLVDTWVLYDNSGESPQLITKGENRWPQ